MFNFEKKVAVITGGSRGIGKEICLKMAERGADIVIVYSKNEDKARIAAEDISKFGHKVLAYKCDVANDEEVKKMIDEIIKKFKKLFYYF